MFLLFILGLKAALAETFEQPIQLSPLAGEERPISSLNSGAKDFYIQQVKAPLEARRNRGELLTRLEVKTEEEPRVFTAELSFQSILANPAPEHPNAQARAVYFRPKTGPADPQVPAVILLHHISNDQTMELEMGKLFASRGLAVLMVYLPFYGPRKGSSDRLHLLDLDFERMKTNMAQAVLDVHVCRDWLMAQPEIDPGRIGLFGISLGSLVAASTGGIDPGFTGGVVLALGGGDVGNVLFSFFGSKVPQGPRNLGLLLSRNLFYPIEPLTWASRYQGTQMLFFSMNDDEVIPPQSRKELLDRLMASGADVGPIDYPGKHLDFIEHSIKAGIQVERFFKGAITKEDLEKLRQNRVKSAALGAVAGVLPKELQ